MNFLERQRLKLYATAVHLRSRPQPENRCVRLGDLEFRNPIGAAAGLDRDGRLLSCFDKLGFGFVEVGTVNHYIDALSTARRLARWQRKLHGKPPMRIGLSIGSLRPSLDAIAIDECAALAHRLVPWSDYLVLNLSRPGSLARMNRIELQNLKTALEILRAECAASPTGTGPRLLVKIAVIPDGGDGYSPAVMQLFEDCCDGIVTAFEGWSSAAAAADWLGARRPALPVIAVGGVRQGSDVDRYLAAGAVLVGLYHAIRFGGGMNPRRLLENSYRSRKTE